MIALVDYGAGNLTSVRKAFDAVGVAPRIVRRAEDLGAPTAIVVPGVGHFAATARLDDGWRAAIVAHAAAGRPLLGICLGMQWLFEASEEAVGCPGLGLLAGVVRRLTGRTPGEDGPMAHASKSGEADLVAQAPHLAIRLKIPHVGWNQLGITRPSSVLHDVADGAHVYFTHSFAAPVTIDSVATTTHGERFAAVVERGRVWGTQFHPEKSGDVGLQILRNFITSL